MSLSRTKRGDPEVVAERLLVLCAMVFLTMALAIWALGLDRPGRIVQQPVAVSDGDCYFDSSEGGVVAPYVVRGRNDGEVWLRIVAGVEGLPDSPVDDRTGAMHAPNGTYTMHGDVLIHLDTDPPTLDFLSCYFAAKPWE